MNGAQDDVTMLLVRKRRPWNAVGPAAVRGVPRRSGQLYPGTCTTDSLNELRNG
jgi:hypothetical protein